MDSVGGGRWGASSSQLVDELGRRNRVEEGQQSGEEASARFERRTPYLCDLRHIASEASSLVVESSASQRWRMNTRMKTGYVALAMCLNIGVDPPDVIKISPCARIECWIDPFSTTPAKAMDAIVKNLQEQYERWQPKAKYKVSLDPTADELKKLLLLCRKNAKSERVLFHYNGHGVPKPTINGEIWLFNKHFTQYIPVSVYELESCLGNPSIYVLDCSAAGMIVNAFCERSEWGSDSAPSTPSIPPMRDCILLAACGAHEILPQNSELPADVFTSCLTAPIKMALRWFCPRSLLCLDPAIVDKIPGKQNDRRTLLGELNWIFTAITDTIAWNMLPRELFQRLFRQDLLVASLFRNFLLAERIMRDANCCPQSYPRLPSTYQHSLWDAWDTAAEVCMEQLPILLSDPAAVFQPSPFFTDQLTAFEVWLEHGSERKKPPEQLPIVLQVLLSQSHRFRALVLLGRYLDMGAWAVDLALSVGIFPYVLKLLQTTAADLRQILVFIWAKILALDKSCQIDLVKDSGHWYFIRFLDSADILPEQRAMAAFNLTVIVDGHRRGQQACIQANLIGVCLSHIQEAINVSDGDSEPLLLQWLCLCLGKLWEGFSDGVARALDDNAPAILGHVLSEPQPEVRAAATYALGTLIRVESELVFNDNRLDEEPDEATEVAEQDIGRCLLIVLGDGSPIVRAELAIALARLASSHNGMFREAAAAYLKPPSNSIVLPAPEGGYRSTGPSPSATQLVYSGSHLDADRGSQTIGGGSPYRSGLRVNSSSGFSGRSAGSAGASPLFENQVSGESVRDGGSTNVGSRSRKRSQDGNIYVQSVTTVYALARDQSPRVACLGRQVLRIMGVDSAQIVVAAKTGANGAVSHERNQPVPAVPPTSPVPGILQRSTSWVASSRDNVRQMSSFSLCEDSGVIHRFCMLDQRCRLTVRTGDVDIRRYGCCYLGGWDTWIRQNRFGSGCLGTEKVCISPGEVGKLRYFRTAGRTACRIHKLISTPAGNLANTWRISTPPPSPPNRQAFLAGPPSSLRRVTSMDISAALNASWDTPRTPIPSTGNTGLAEAVGLLSSNLESAAAPLVPESTFFRWSCGHFSRPLLEPAHDDDEEILARRERREREALDGIALCEHSSVSKVSDQIASWDTGSEMGTKAVLLHPFRPLVCVADYNETIRIWDYEEAAVVNTFDNHNTPDKGVSKLCLLNETDDSLLLVASSDGSVRVWRDYTQKDNQHLATAWQSLQGHKPGSRSISAVVDWQQMTGYLYASGPVSWIMVWDLDREQLISTISSHSDSIVSAMAACQTHSAHVITGCGDGYVRVYDIRSQDMLVCAMKPHAQKVVGLDFLPGVDSSKIISASPAGDLKFLDMRKSSEPYLERNAHKGHLTSLTAHRHAPVIATGSGKQLIKTFSTNGELLSMVRYHSSYLGQRIGSVNDLCFHPYKVLVAAGTVDSMVSIYAGGSIQGI